MKRRLQHGLTAMLFIVISAQHNAFAAPASDPPPFAWPFVSETFRMTAAFDLDLNDVQRADWTGWRLGEPTAGNGHSYDGHRGTDWGMPTGTNLHAPAAGRVFGLRESVPNDDHSDTGNYLILDHRAATGTSLGGRDYRTRYWHLAQDGVVPASVNSAVTKGSLIAISDNTGNSTGPHLHYAVALLPGDRQTCAFYNAWWQQDEFYSQNTRPCLVYLQIDDVVLNVREGASGSYNIITSLPPRSRVVATQHNTWWRVMLPLPPSRAYEARNALGGFAPGYSETGAWTNWASRSQVVDNEGDANYVSLSGTGSRASTFGPPGDAADVATFNFTVPPQKGLYDVYTTWPSDANARNVTYRVTHSGGTSNVTMDQIGHTAGSGNGTKASPYVITQNPYVVNHTTIGAQNQWNLYTPQGSNLPQEGPENLYRFEMRRPGSVTITVDHTGYPGKDIDIHLLSAANPNTCFQRADWTLTAQLEAGVYYIACDSYGSGAAGNARATNYKLTVEFSDEQPFPNRWVKVGSFTYNAGANGSVQVREQTVTGPVNPSAPSRIVADAIKVVPRITRRTGWISNAFANRINTASNPVASVVIKTDTTPNNDSDSIDAYAEVPIYSAPAPGTFNSSDIVGKAVTGQRFVCTTRAGDWYKVWLTNGTAATEGWILGNHLTGYHLNFASEVGEWELYD